MPQNEPMSSEDLAREARYDAQCLDFPSWDIFEEKLSVTIKKRDAQRDRAILEAAAERALESIKYLADPDIDFIVKQAILAPLAEVKS